VFVSDGLPEARSTAGEDFGYDRVERILMANAGASPKSLVISLAADLTSFLEGRVPDDDVSIAVLRKS
jgi:serine phosphatase RsbU (regulator of sigma subunit)